MKHAVLGFFGLSTLLCLLAGWVFVRAMLFQASRDWYEYHSEIIHRAAEASDPFGDKGMISLSLSPKPWYVRLYELIFQGRLR